MASIKELGKGEYRLHFCLGKGADGKYYRPSKVINAKSMAEAKRVANEMEVDLRREFEKSKTSTGSTDSQKTPHTFMDVVEKWRKVGTVRLAAKTYERYEGILENSFIPYFGEMDLESIRPLTIIEYLAELSTKVSPLTGKVYSQKTVKNYYALLHRLFKCAFQWEWLETNPCSRVPTLKVDKKEAKYYNDDQINKMLAHLKKMKDDTKASLDKSIRYARMDSDEAEKRRQVRLLQTHMYCIYAYLALTTGGRRGELTGLQWSDIEKSICADKSDKPDTVDKNEDVHEKGQDEDQEKSSEETEQNKKPRELFNLVIRRTLNYTPASGLYIVDKLKNGEPLKLIPLAQGMVDMLNEYKASQDKVRELMGDAWEKSDFIFTTIEGGNLTKPGGPILPDVISKWFVRFLKKYKLTKITLHQLRHSNISYLIYNGVPVDVVAEIAGHSPEVCREIYEHIYPKAKREAVDHFDKLFESKEQVK